MSKDTRKYLASKIAPSSILGDAVEVISRHIILPFQKVKYFDSSFFYTGKVIDNSSAEITKITEESYFKDDFTNLSLNGKISGLEISIRTQEKVRESSITKIKKSGRHNAQLLNLSKITFAELIKEERDIINSQEYHQLKELRIENKKEEFIILK